LDGVPRRRPGLRRADLRGRHRGDRGDVLRYPRRSAAHPERPGPTHGQARSPALRVDPPDRRRPDRLGARLPRPARAADPTGTRAGGARCRSLIGIGTGGGEDREVTPPTGPVLTWARDRPGAGGATQLVEAGSTDHRDGRTAVVMTDRGLRDEPSEAS